MRAAAKGRLVDERTQFAQNFAARIIGIKKIDDRKRDGNTKACTSARSRYLSGLGAMVPALHYDHFHAPYAPKALSASDGHAVLQRL
ncbi:MAG: hypothetical protein AAFR64_11520 [Pseudomonadota bacterium]